ncbi:TPA: autotransporter outer membrane beta-barrel domain-containing protein [Yersinia enterocolitica]|uniref:autotransporter outer membrane beta-barrel domain-containing protein n=1 Tax=Yersinia enterocolitica TaxID=630 RepID=UPI002A7A28C1|nr:autotransporter outer membrane beta-barrel domain-containing protein [Yersinia enterocolitica]HDL7965556.1 autotransporter outer membrane beta-barrel domain-containing protein [Yersinia enterocolitica]HEN3292697.1 autotransporter outer membrane beta-barrel domain-containing protein [Yersinia enterocolitica]HEN3493133.1 autotransporter outer membrane beta-barrel domain-containing protein [Yersinia enterocolitica]
MENINNPRENISKKPIFHQKKFTSRIKPIAKFVAATLFIVGSSSAISYANNTPPALTGVVNAKNVTLAATDIAKDAVIDEESILILKENSSAQNLIVHGKALLTGNSKAINSKIYDGNMLVDDSAVVEGTEIGFVPHDDMTKTINTIFGSLMNNTYAIRGTMHISKDGKASQTIIGMNGALSIDGGTVENTNILDGGELITNYNSEGNLITLKNTEISGVFILEPDSEVTLKSITKFLPTARFVTNNGGDITNEGELIFENSGVISAFISGEGQLIKRGINTLTLQGSGNSKRVGYKYSGNTYIENGTLELSNVELLNSPIIFGEKHTFLVLDKNSKIISSVQNGNITIKNNSLWEISESSIIDNLTIGTGGEIKFNHGNKVGNNLTIDNNYSSDGGTLTFYSKLEGDDSETDNMLVKGNTSGDTNVKIHNLGGAGAKTDFGILLIKVKGLSDGNFKQMGRNVAGAFEYFLGRGEGDRSKNWYMISDAAIVDKQPMAEKKIEEAKPESEENKIEVNPPLPESAENNSSVNSSDSRYHQVENVSYKHDLPSPRNNPVSAFFASLPEKVPEKIKEEVAESTDPVPQDKDLKDKSDNTPEVKGSEEQENPLRESIAVPLNKAVNKNAPQKTYQPVYRPENGSYIANLSMARNLFTSDLDNRSGNYKYKDAATGEWRTSSMWIQTQGGIKQFGKTVDQLNIKGKYYSVQLGGDVAKWDVGTQGSGRIGMLAGMGKATNHSKSNITGYYSNGSVNGYNLGVYATWLTDQQNKTGLYIDTLVQYSWFNNAVNGQELAEEKYKSSGFTSSIESGYTFNIGSTEQLSYFIQPNAKITWVGINAQTHTATNKDIINYTNRGQLITRIGAKTYLQTTNNSEQQFMPFIAINWLHQNHNTGTQLSGQGVENGSKNSAEFKIGVESKIDQRLHAWANINHQIGNYNTSDTNALVGIKYAF